MPVQNELQSLGYAAQLIVLRTIALGAAAVLERCRPSPCIP